MTPLTDWLESHPLGNRGAAVTTVATAVGVTAPAVRHWINGTRTLPLSKAYTVERCTGVPCEDLCPGVEWERDDLGRVTGYRVPLPALDAVTKAPAGT